MTKSLLAVSHDAKTVKGEKLGVLTGVMYLAPNDVSGYEVCPKATEGCKKACLYSAGRGRFTSTQEARINKTKMFFEQRTEFMTTLAKNIVSLEKKAKKNNMIPAVRLNGTSDIAWEKQPVTINGITHKNLMVAFPHIQFYDYTKIAGRKTAISLSNYHLTFSLAENNDNTAFKAIEEGYNVAVVLDIAKSDSKPTEWNGYPVIDGDESDVRFNDPKGGHIVALTAKGDAKKDTSGFVRKRINFERKP
jgi:hypothetical protein